MKYVKTFLQSYVLQNKQIFLSLSFIFAGDIWTNFQSWMLISEQVI